MMDARKWMVGILVLGLGVFSSSVAEADFTQSMTYVYAGSTSIKISEPANFKVSAIVNGKAIEDTLPAIIPVPDMDAYVPLTITAPDGKTWSGKIEVKKKQQTQLAFKYTPDVAAPAAAAPAHKYLGRVYNATNRCSKSARRDMKVEFVKDGAKAYEFEVTTGKLLNAVEMSAGTYDVRVYERAGASYAYTDTVANVAVAADKWLFAWGCRDANASRSARITAPE